MPSDPPITPSFRAGPGAVALETTLLAHGVPGPEAAPLAADLARIVRDAGAEPAVVGVVGGRPIVGMTDPELAELLAEPDLPKVNSANLGLTLHQRRSGATTVSATMELAAAAGVRVFATGGIGGVHKARPGAPFDASSDLLAFTRFPVCVVASGVKSILDVESTREALETLGVPVVGFRTDRFPAFYLRESDAAVDERFDEVDVLARFAAFELDRTGRGVLVVNPPPVNAAISPEDWAAWLGLAEERVKRNRVTGRAVTPATLAALHEFSDGATLRANLALVRDNAALAARICAAMPR